MKRFIMDGILWILFYSPPKIAITNKEVKLFNYLLESSQLSPSKEITYDLSIPKYKFLQYLSNRESFVFHGSNNSQITTFEPRKQSLYHGEIVQAVFATKDPIWSTFYAVLDKEILEMDLFL